MATINKTEMIVNILENLDECERVDIWNQYTGYDNRYDDQIYSMDSFEEIMEGTELIRLASMVTFGEFNPHDDWFWFNGYGNLVSSDFPTMDCRSPYDLHDLGEYIQDNGESFGVSEIDDVFEM